MTTLKDRLKEARADAGISQAALARLAKCGQTTIASIENGRNQGSTVITKLATALNVNPVWLAEGKPPKRNSDAQSRSEEQNVLLGPDVRGRIPLISWVQAGTWSDVIDIYEPGYAERWLPFLKNNGENVFALRVEGDSMTARFGKSYPDGCIIFVDPDQRMPTNGDRIVAKLVGSQKTTFKSYTEDAGRKWLRPLNDSHPPIYDEFFVIGKVIGKWEDD